MHVRVEDYCHAGDLRRSAATSEDDGRELRGALADLAARELEMTQSAISQTIAGRYA